ncbi:hypothetical protein ERJ75_001161000 [Trypanosoma vivax]|nr:hypothetical protein ERJ75_001161000 [Trypanosoma vivax]
MVPFIQATLTHMLFKLMQSIVAHLVLDCIKDKLQPQQAGFRAARSTLDTPMQVTSAAVRRKDGKKMVASFIDYIFAFD